jgi:hypothetical protein
MCGLVYGLFMWVERFSCEDARNVNKITPWQGGGEIRVTVTTLQVAQIVVERAQNLGRKLRVVP